MGRSFEEKFAILKKGRIFSDIDTLSYVALLYKGPHYNGGYNTLQQARDDGAITLAYG